MAHGMVIYKVGHLCTACGDLLLVDVFVYKHMPIVCQQDDLLNINVV